VRAVMKQLEAEVASVDVLSQQLSAKLAAFGDTADGFMTNCDEKSKSCWIDVAIFEHAVSVLVPECWELVTSASGEEYSVRCGFVSYRSVLSWSLLCDRCSTSLCCWFVGTARG
jgi:hypothetical protein